MKVEQNNQVATTFVNTVMGRGIFNGVVNVQLGTLQFDAGEDGKINNDLVTTVRLRMDIQCATMLRDELNDLLAFVEKAKAEAAIGVAANGDASAHVSEGKPN